MKERKATNSINILYNSVGTKLTTTTEIKEETKSFYMNLIGSAAHSLTGIDVEVVRNGNQLTVEPVSNFEIDDALKGIDVNKALGLDGLNNMFFKKAWGVVKEEVYAVVHDFFHT